MVRAVEVRVAEPPAAGEAIAISAGDSARASMAAISTAPLNRIRQSYFDILGLTASCRRQQWCRAGSSVSDDLRQRMRD